MNFNKLAVCLVWVVAVLVSAPAHSALFEYLKSGPKGSLLVVGGGDSPDTVLKRFVELAPRHATPPRIAILPMASEAFDEEASEMVADMQRFGAHAEIVEVDRNGAHAPEEVKRIQGFDGYWFLGGDQSRLTTLLGGTPFIRAIDQRYQQGAVVGGTSAGASVMSGVMLTGRWRAPESSEETEFLNIAKRMLEVSSGFGFFPGAIVDQHFMKRARYNRLLSAVLDHPQLLGVGIDEETALLVHPGGMWEVIGNHYVKIVDARSARVIDDDDVLAKASDVRLHILPSGSRFDPKRKRVWFNGE